METARVAVCEAFDAPIAGFGDGPADCAGVLLNRIRRSVRVPGRGLNFEVLFRDCRREDLDNEFSLEFHVAEGDLKAILDLGSLDLIGACKRWIEEHDIDDAGPHVLPIDYFVGPGPRKLAA